MSGKDDPPQRASGALSVNLQSAESESKKRSRELAAVWRQGLAGGIAGCAAKTIVAPLERIKILFQTANAHFLPYSGSWNGLFHAARYLRISYGLSAFFKGHSASLIRVFPYAGINFLAFEQLRNAVITSPDRNTLFLHFICGSMAGATSVFITYPLELVRIRLAFETARNSHSSWLSIVRNIYFERGRNGSLLNFYPGIFPTILGILPYAGTSFAIHNVMKRWLSSPSLAPYTVEMESPQRLNTVAQLLCGAIAGVAAQTVSYPIDTVRRRRQVGTLVGSNGGVLKIARCIFRENGVKGFYVGMTIGYLKMAPMVATSFYVYDRVSRLVDV